MKNNDLDKFYTNPKIINNLLLKLDEKLNNVNFGKIFQWIEPSAGSGNFVDALKKKYNTTQIISYDIEPHNNDEIKKQDFLKLDPIFSINNVVIGNPPFGKKSALAIEFMNKSFEWANVIAFILPNQFKRYLTQKKIVKKAKLISENKIEENSFLVGDREYNVNCVFQIWVSNEDPRFKKFYDKRIKKPPKIKHNDLKTFIYNNTKETLKYFDQDLWKWDYAVPRQGYYNYNKLIRNSKDLNKKIQYFFIKCKNEISHKIIKKINFTYLSKTNTSIPGFSTTNFIKEYEKEKKKYMNQSTNN